MRNKLVPTLIALVILMGCVQPSSKKTVTVLLHVNGKDSIQSVGIRGKDQPLSWDYDYELTPVIPDSIYTCTFSLVTGYKYTEAKFTVDGAFELNDADNRKIVFSDSDSTLYEATYDVVN